ncbi:protein LONGIFOLIA 1-like [Iris pallida]|uniref:Protein LONGIFOLIA 1-like n=1 Tax=Iris pallida TaxID=29817 RepID=A0AAX6E7R2_IRIPA|nr:protein LONGIFOLIA 1-like [Iris pallida]
MSDGGSGDKFGRSICKFSPSRRFATPSVSTAPTGPLSTPSRRRGKVRPRPRQSRQLFRQLEQQEREQRVDVIQGLEDLGFSHGFAGASDVRHCPVDSGPVRDIVQFVSKVEEVPFALAFPKFRIVRSRTPAPSFAWIEEKPAGDHISDWLPPFPNPHSYSTAASFC